MCVARQCAVLRTLVGICPLAISSESQQESIAQQLSMPSINYSVGKVRFHMMVIVPKERDRGHRFSWQLLVLWVQLGEISPAGKWLQAILIWVSQTWTVVPLITSDVIGTHNGLAEKYLPEPGTYLVAWFHSCFYRPGNHGHSILRPTDCLMCLLHCQEIMLFPTLCVSFVKYTISKGNQLYRGPRLLRQTMEHVGKLITQLSKQRKQEHVPENLAQDEGAHRLFPGIRSPPSTHPICKTAVTPWAIDLSQNPVWWWLQWE